MKRATIKLVRGDIARQPDLDAIVNAANAELRPGGGVAGAIHSAAGPELERACRPLAPISPGEAVITPAFKLPNTHIIHCLGPVYGEDEPAAELLALCYRRAIQLAAEHKLASIGFPAISAGIFGYPMREAADVALRAVNEASRSARTITTIRFVLFDESALKTFRAAAGGE